MVRAGNPGDLRVRVLLALAMALSLGACSSKNDELDRFISDTKQQPGGRVEPLPEVKPYESFAYSAATMRSPFQPGGSGQGPSGPGSAQLRPDQRRNREFLEQFSLDTLKMVGTLKIDTHTYGLVQTKDGLVHRVQPGNYVGQSDGKVVEISPSKISVVEITPDGLGGYMERPAALALNTR
ncbi:MAG: pilus assembly protein PilP [Pseudomonadales bacterium]|nr:pilus assembly protein PilP [Pseudomonadales bacterium]